MERTVELLPDVLPSHPLQSIILRHLITRVPYHLRTPLFPLPAHAAWDTYLSAAALFSSSDPPALAPHIVFRAFRRCEFARFDLTCARLAALAPAHVAAMLADVLIAQSGRVELQTISVSSAHIASTRAAELFLRLVKSAVEGGGLEGLSVVWSTQHGAGVLRKVVGELVGAMRGADLLRLSVSGLGYVNEVFEEMVTTAGGRLQELDVSMTEVGCREVAAVFGGEKGIRESIRVLDFGGSRVGGEGVMALVGLPNLTRLSLAWTPAVRPAGVGKEEVADACVILEGVIRSLPKLRVLDLSGSTTELEEVLGETTLRLRELVLHSSRLDDVVEMMLFARKLPNTIEALNLSACNGSARVDLLLRGLGERSFTSLRRLEMARCELPGWDGGNIGELGSLLPGLRELDVSEIGTITAEVLVSIVTSPGLHERLEKLVVRGLNIPGFAEYLHDVCESSNHLQGANGLAFPHMKALDLTDSVLAKDEHYLTWLIGVFCTGSKIESLRVGGMRHLAFDAVLTALDSCWSTISLLDVSHCVFPLAQGDGARDPLISSACLTKHGLPQLELLGVNDCFGQIPADLVELLRTRAPKLDRVIHSDSNATGGLPLGREALRRDMGIALAEAAALDERKALAQTPWRNRHSLP